MGSGIFGQDIDASADSISFVGDNIIAEGHVAIKYKDIWISADKAIINVTVKDVEATGRVKFIQRKRRNAELRYEDYLKLLDNPDVKVTRNGYIMTPTGNQLVDVSIVEEVNSWNGKKAVGNLETGVFDLGEFKGHYGAYFISGKSAERTPKGGIEIEGAKVTTCEYACDHHEHYSISSSTVQVWPDDDDESSRYVKDSDHYSMLAYNNVLRVFDIPIFYFPILYKPPWDKGLGIHARGGSNTDWGYYLQLKKVFKVPTGQYLPNTKVSLFADFYSKRGFGGGAALETTTQNTRTDAFVYGIRDKDVKKRKARMKFPEDRYDLWVSHLNHITPRLDFRGHFEKLSDIDFLHDFFRTREDIDPQPTSFGSLEYQFDRLSLALYVRPRVNDFFSVVEKLPEIRLDVPRQELFKGLYYQGEMSLNYMRMKWRDHHYPRSKGGNNIKDYQSFRFDSLNMFYYPFKVSKINFIPRAGVRFTGYSKSSKQKIDNDMLINYAKVDNPYVDDPSAITNYDSKGGGQFRVAAEFGLEVNTKFHRNWSDVKSAFWELDGLRHVVVPYVNYNFIPKPTVDRKKLYYFDDIDRIEEQNFVRVGVKNRLQTRRGAYGAQEIYDWASIEHYIDFHFNNTNGDGMGNFGTKIHFQPFAELSFDTDLLINMGDSGISRFAPTLEYAINEDWKLRGGYYYQNSYTELATYSMGSSLTDMTSGTAFEKPYSRNQFITGGLEFPLIDDKTKGEFGIDYNFEETILDNVKFGVIRSLHCWDIGFEYRIRQRHDDMDEETWEHAFMFTLSLSAVPGFKISAKQEAGGANQ